MIGGLVAIFKFLAKVFHWVGIIDHLKDLLFGTEESLSLSKRNEAVDAKMELLVNKVDQLSKRPAMNGGFSSLVQNMNDVKAQQEALARGQEENRIAAAAVAELARLAVHTAVTSAAQVEDNLRRMDGMHKENQGRFDDLDSRMDAGAIREQTYLATLIEKWGMDLENPPTAPLKGELRGEVRVVLQSDDDPYSNSAPVQPELPPVPSDPEIGNR